VEALGSRSLRSVAFGVVALALAYVVGVVEPGFRKPLALAAVFVLVVTAEMLGVRRIAQWVQLHPLLTLVVMVVVLLALLWLFIPTPMGPR
jgi:hypothetical protein